MNYEIATLNNDGSKLQPSYVSIDSESIPPMGINLI